MQEHEFYSALLQKMPPILRGMIKAIGLEKTQELLTRFGGTPIVLPKNKSEKLGLTESELFALHCELECHLSNDNRLSLPKVDKVFIIFRNYEIRILRKNYSLTALALKYGLTTRQIQNICKESETELLHDLDGSLNPPPQRQRDLFL